MKNWVWILFSAFLFIGCQQLPTKVYEQSPTQSKASSQPGAIQITSQTVIVDARPAFDYSVSHLNGSLALRPEDFTQREEKFRGLLEADHFSLARRLARLGIGPDTPVVVVGRGLQGRGEEGRVAWTLKRLGVKNVQFAAIDYFSIPLSTAEAPPRAYVPIWKPEGDESLEVSRKVFLQAVMKPRTATNSPVVIDVRPSEEYLGKVSSRETKPPPDIGAINIPWTEFFRQNGLPQESIRPRLESIGLTSDRPVYVISNQGIESAAVTMVLREWGFRKAANYSGGYVELMSSRF